MKTVGKITLDKYVPRDYQRGLFDAIENKGLKKALLIHPRRCLAANTPVSMANGQKKYLQDIRVGDKIVSFNGKDFEVDTVVDHWDAGEKETLLLSTASGISIRSSYDHLFAVEETFLWLFPRIRWVKAKDLTPSHKLLFYSDIKDEYNKDSLFYDHIVIKEFDRKRTALFDIKTEKNHNFVANGYVVHNSGKDITVWNLCIRLLLRKVGICYYIFPTYNQARKAIWQSMNNEGLRFLDYIPPELIHKKNDQEMRIVFTNGSSIQLVGSSDWDKLMGTNPSLLVYSEYAIQDPRAKAYLTPIVLANKGTQLFVSTVRGYNHLHQLYMAAKDSPEWYCSFLTLDDTKHIDPQEIENMIEAGEMSRELARQEFWNDFSLGAEGAYYIRYLDQMRLDGRIGDINYLPSYPVHTSWDIGVRDYTSVLFFQVVNTNIHFIDCIQDKDYGLEHYAHILNSLPYRGNYGHHFGPHDLAQREWGNGMTRIDKAKELGINFELAPNVRIMDGIEAVRTTLPRCYIDEKRCKILINALTNYRKELNEKSGLYGTTPVHDLHSHVADSLRYACLSIPKCGAGMTAQEYKEMTYRAMYGNRSVMPGPFRQY